MKALPCQFNDDHARINQYKIFVVYGGQPACWHRQVPDWCGCCQCLVLRELRTLGQCVAMSHQFIKFGWEGLRNKPKGYEYWVQCTHTACGPQWPISCRMITWIASEICIHDIAHDDILSYQARTSHFALFKSNDWPRVGFHLRVLSWGKSYLHIKLAILAQVKHQLQYDVLLYLQL